MKTKMKGGKYMKKKQVLGIFAFSMIAILGISLVAAGSFNKGFMSSISEEDRAEMKESMEAIRSAIESGDYDSWKALMEDRIAKMQEQITEENFQLIVERHEEHSEIREAMIDAKESGDYETLQELKAEHGWNKNDHHKKGFHGKYQKE